MTKPGLASLLYPRSPKEFFPHLDSAEYFFVEKASNVRALTELPFLESFDKLLGSWPHPVQAHLPKVADEASALDVSVTDAYKLFENGMGLMFDHAERFSLELSRWLEGIRTDLGASALTQSRCLIYATPDGKGTSPHFDQNANFVLQLHGTKKWWLAPNHHVSNPMSRYTMGLPLDLELQTYAKTPFPMKMPPDANQVVLTAGSLLFVPSGMWHSTQAEGDALSLNFTYHAPAWLDLLTSALRSRLARSSEWRAPAYGLTDPLRYETARIELDRLLVGLAESFHGLKAIDILAATES